MVCLPDNRVLYHGSYCEVQDIDLKHCSRGMDFGRGFYVTSSRQQAISYIPSSVRKAIRQKRIPANYPVDDGRLNTYRLDEATPELFVHCFRTADIEWLHYVACQRNEKLFPKLRWKYREVDIIGGKVADDATSTVLNAYVNGGYGEPGTVQADRMALQLLIPDRLEDQFCFRTPDAIAALSFEGSERYGDLR